MATLSLSKTNLALEDGVELRISTAEDDLAWDNFLARTPGGHHVQSSLWGRVKAWNHWEAFRILAEANGQIVGGAQLLIRPLPFHTSVVYVPKGPLVLEEDLALSGLLIQQILRLGLRHHAQLVVIQPPSNAPELARLLSALGLTHSTLELAPVASLLLDLTPPLEEILKNMKRQTRQNIRRSAEAGLTVRLGEQADLPAFYEFHKATGLRQGFVPYPLEYYQNMWQTFAPRGCIELLMAECDGQPISGLLLITFGDTVIAKVLGWSGARPELRPNDALFWNAIQHSKEQGSHFFDFEGIDLRGARAMLAGLPLPADLQHSPDFLKLGYGGRVVIYPAAYEFLPNSLLRWGYKRAAPTINGDSLVSHWVDRLRKH